MHDSIAGVDLLAKKDRHQPLYADGAYTGEAFETAVAAGPMAAKPTLPPISTRLKKHLPLYAIFNLEYCLASEKTIFSTQEQDV